MAINLITDDTGHRGVAVVAAAAAAIMASTWVRRLPNDAPLARHGSTVCLLLAAAAFFVAVIVPRLWSGSAVLVMVGFTAIAALIPSDRLSAARLIAGAAAIAAGVGLLAENFLFNEGLDDYWITTLEGISAVLWGLAFLRSRPRAGALAVPGLVLPSIESYFKYGSSATEDWRLNGPGSVVAVILLIWSVARIFNFPRVQTIAFAALGLALMAWAVVWDIAIPSARLLSPEQAGLGCAALYWAVGRHRKSATIKGFSALIAGMTELSCVAYEMLGEGVPLAIAIRGGLGLAALIWGSVTLKDESVLLICRSSLSRLTSSPAQV